MGENTRDRGKGMIPSFGTGLACIIIIVSVLVLFLLSREIICWCWKINERVALLTEIRDLLLAKGKST